MALMTTFPLLRTELNRRVDVVLLAALGLSDDHTFAHDYDFVRDTQRFVLRYQDRVEVCSGDYDEFVMLLRAYAALQDTAGPTTPMRKAPKWPNKW